VAAASLDAPRIRDAREDDLPAILEILNHAILTSTASWSESPKTISDIAAWFAARRGAGHPVIVAETAGVVVGYAACGPFRAGEGYRLTTEHSVYVAEDRRRAGIGRALMAALIARARAAGFTRMVGALGADREASLAFHRALGFEEQGRLRGVGRKRGRLLDLVLVVLALDAGAPGASSGSRDASGRG
jgi:phosphinothricin acetyltransferase